ncbi:MAG: type II toxin-antitoxin system VapC family toxin [bacterium]|nr:type II toxin-antitoxin system VapC family toxin [bacterium]
MSIAKNALLSIYKAGSGVLVRLPCHALLSGVHENANIQVIPVTTHLFLAGMAMHAERADKSWSLTDCISFIVMRENQATEALTHDRHFEQAGFRALLREVPPA